MKISSFVLHMFSGNSSVFVNVAFGVDSVVVENRPVSVRSP